MKRKSFFLLQIEEEVQMEVDPPKEEANPAEAAGTAPPRSERARSR